MFHSQAFTMMSSDPSFLCPVGPEVLKSQDVTLVVHHFEWLSWRADGMDEGKADVTCRPRSTMDLSSAICPSPVQPSPGPNSKLGP
jgi:hypothetical protein